MGDVRFQSVYERVRTAADRVQALRSLDDEEVVAALAAAARESDPYLANVLATEAQNRMRRNATIFRTAGEGIAVLDRRGHVLSVNPAGLELMGRDAGELVGQPFHDVVQLQADGAAPGTFDATALAARVLEQALSWETPRAWIQRPEGREVPITLSASPIVVDGMVEGAVLLFRDVTDEVRAQRELAESEERHRSLAQHNPDAVYALDLEGRFLDCNPALVAMSGFSQEELRHVPFDPLVAPEDRERTRARFAEAAQGRPQRYQATLLRKDGTRARLLVTNVPIYVGGAIVGVYGIAKDITRQLEDEARIRYFSSVLEAQAEASPDAVVVIDQQGRVVYHNRRFVQMWGFPEDLLARRDDAALLAHARHVVAEPDVFADRVRRLYAERPERSFDVLRFRDGRIVERHGAGVRGKDGTEYGWVWTFHDITDQQRERERHERELGQSEARYRLLYENAPAMYFSIGYDGIIRSVNRFGARYLGYTPAELEGLPVVRLAHPEDRPEAERRMVNFLAGPTRASQLDFRKVTRDGETLWVRDILIKVEGSDGERILLNICEDISRQRRWSETVEELWQTGEP